MVYGRQLTHSRTHSLRQVLVVIVLALTVTLVVHSDPNPPCVLLDRSQHPSLDLHPTDAFISIRFVVFRFVASQPGSHSSRGRLRRPAVSAPSPSWCVCVSQVYIYGYVYGY